MPYLPDVGNGFLLGLFVLLGYLFAAFLVLVAYYFLAEFIVVLADIARNMKATRQIAEQYDKTKSAP